MSKPAVTLSLKVAMQVISVKQFQTMIVDKKLWTLQVNQNRLTDRQTDSQTHTIPPL